MSEKIVEKFLYEGLGFRIELHNVEMISFNNEFHPLIDVKKVAEQAIQNLSTQQNKYTGNQLMFIRTYLMMNTSEFAKLITSTAQDIKKWESSGNKPIKMAANVEASLKQHLQNHEFINSINAARENTQLLSSKNLFSGLKPNGPKPSADSNKENQPPKKPKKS